MKNKIKSGFIKCWKYAVIIFVSCATVAVAIFGIVLVLKPLKKVDEKASTCVEQGNIQYWENTITGVCFKDSEGREKFTDDSQFMLPLAEHKLEHYSAKSPTCTQSGNLEYWQCTVCKNNFTDENGEKELGGLPEIEARHEEVIDEAVSVTCTTNGKTEGKHCSVCNVVLVAQKEIEAPGHAFTEEKAEEKYLKTAATCTDKAIYYKSCEMCGEKGTTTFAYGEVPGHTEVIDKAVPAMCTTKGKTEGKHCSLCNAVLVAQKEIEAPGHTFSEEKAEEKYLKTAATCTDKAVYYKSCEVCGERGTTTFAYGEVLEHKEVIDEAVPATYTSKGKTEGKHCSLCNAVLVAQKDIEPLLEFTLLDSDAPSYSISGCNIKSDTSVIIPETYNDAPITAIESNAFKNNTHITSITVPDSVISIGEGAFSGCSKLESITLPFIGGSVKTENDTFQYPFGYIFGTSWYRDSNCATQYYYGSDLSSTTSSGYYIPSSLKSVTITGGNILYGAFYNCGGLSDITISGGATYIDSHAFYYCSRLTSITIPESVTYIGDSAFYYCSGLTSMTIPESVKYIGDSAFYNCDGLTSMTIPDGVTSIGASTFSGCSGLTSITIPDSVTNIANSAFSGCSGLTRIAIPDSVTSIGDSAFSGCSGLTSVIIPDSVTSIGEYAFGNNRGLTIYCEVNSRPSGWDYWWDRSLTVDCPVVWNCLNNEVDDDGYAYAVIDGIRYAFKNNTAIVAEQPVSIKDEINIPSSVTYNNALFNVIGISDSAFYGCGGLTSVTIPDSVTSIGGGVFYRCVNLQTVKLGAGIKSLGSDQSSLYPYTTYGFFEGCTSLISITIPNSVTNIGDSAFAGCSGLTSVTIPNSVTSIGNSAFYGCNGLTSITIPDGVTSIGDLAFYNCSSLTSITIPDSVTNIGGGVFYKCTKLKTVELGKQIKSLNDYKLSSYPYSLYGFFGECNALTSVTIPDGVTSIGDSAFYNCNSLTSITIPDSVTSIGNSGFYGCSGLTSITIGNGVTKISDSAFFGCGELTSITISKSVTSIGDKAFKGCGKLAEIYYGGTAEDWTKIEILGINSAITSATKYYFSEAKPTLVGNYWHYVDGDIVVWKQ